MDEGAIELVAREAKCLAIHTQANAGNFGFNTVSKYPRADFICVSEKEIRLEARQRQKDLYRIVEQAAEKLGASRAFRAPIVTEVVPLAAFYPADRHHQDFYRKNRSHPYSAMYIAPKVKKADKLKAK